MNVPFGEVRGTGWNALIAAVVVQAIFDADKGDQEAEEWLMSDGCKFCLGFLGISGSVEDLAKRNRIPKKRRSPATRHRRPRRKQATDS